MFGFLNSRINKKALKKAMLELEEEALISNQVQVESVKLREYKTNSEDAYKQLKRSSVLAKPQTESVDLKNFKDWRNKNTDSKVTNKPFSNMVSFSDDDDEGEQPAIENPVATKKINIIDKIASINKAVDKTEKDDSKMSDFFREKYQVNIPSKEEPVKQNTQNVNVDKTFVRTGVKTTLNELLKKNQANKQISSSVNDIKQEAKVELPKNSDKIKVEVVNFYEPESKTKKIVNRKPRGKNKRRFDADVISSVDWK